jgi:hypothetical protein
VQLSLTRLRVAFLSLGALLLGVLLLFVSSALARLDHQRELRHRVVAERIFDELERELTAHLVTESERPSSAYDSPTTSPAAWAPFVVGYFTVADGYRIVAREQLAPERVARLSRALSSVWPGPASEKSAVEVPAVPEKQLAPTRPASDKNAAKAVGRDVQSSSEVLRQLNRAKEDREQQQRRAKPSKRTDIYKEDPFEAF